jgi:uncharacterized protein (TIGR03435 family)
MTDDQRESFQDQMRERMRSLLTERFQVAIHHETRKEPVYALVVAKGGPKLAEHKDADGKRQGIRSSKRGQFNGTNVPVHFLATLLSNQLGRPVLDQTGLAGKYDFKLEWTPDPLEITVPPGIDPGPPPDLNGPTLFTAVQEQLGLRLESPKGPVIVVDRAEIASEN